MNKTLKIVLIFTLALIFLLWFGYKKIDEFINHFHEDDNYVVTKEMVRSKENVRIDSFTIVVYRKVENGSTLNSGSEISRYCCVFRGKTRPKKVVYFDRLKDDYFWQRCDLNLAYVENDSLKNLSLEEKRKMINIDTARTFDRMPFEFQSNQVYQIFGLKGIDGSYFFEINNSTNEIEIEYFEGGPF